MAKQNSNWSTTFFWEQDLRSLYMNGLLNSILKPGIYNANIGVFASTGMENAASTLIPKTPGVYLYLKRGTTFVFSNNYKYIKVNNDRKIISDPETAGNFLIKSTVLNDIIEPIITIETLGNKMASSIEKAFFGFYKENSETHTIEEQYIPLPEIYITANIKFNGEGALDTSTSGYDSKPTFSWAINKSSEYYTASLSTLDSIKESLNPFTKIAKLIADDENYLRYGKGFYFIDEDTINSTTGYFRHLFHAEGEIIPENDQSMLGPGTFFQDQYYDRVSSLLVGRCIRKQNTPGASSNSPYITIQGVWANGGQGCRAWNKDYVFSGLGLATYRQEQTPDYTVNRPSILPIFNHALSKDEYPLTSDSFAFDLKDIFIKDKFWSYENSKDFYQTLITCNSDITSKYSLCNFHNETYLKDLNLTSEGQNFIGIDFFYTLLKEKHDRSTPLSLEDLMKQSESYESAIKQFSFITSTETSIWDTLIIPSSFKNKYESFNLLLQTRTLPEGVFSQTIATDSSGEDQLNNALNILDVSPLNTKRLQKVLEKTNLVNNIIDYFRQVDPAKLRLEESQDLSAKPADALLPLALVFRPIILSKEQEGETIEVIRQVPGDGIATLEGIAHPANILDFFALHSSGNKIYTVDLGNNDLYTVLPIMD